MSDDGLPWEVEGTPGTVTVRLPPREGSSDEHLTPDRAEALAEALSIAADDARRRDRRID